MLPAKLRSTRVLFGLILAAAAGLIWWSARGEQQGTEPVGLFTTLPILWSESPDIGAELNPAAEQHWARGVLRKAGPIEPIDVLDQRQGPFGKLHRLVMAQPRVLGPQENVALDAWVRGGGQLLLLADPALTEHSDFALSDPRRPQAVALLSPVLSHWGLELRIDEGQQFGEQQREVRGATIPVNLPGHFMIEGQPNCRLWADGLAVTCKIGNGRVVALADAAVLERLDPEGTRAKGFAWLLDAAFAAD